MADSSSLLVDPASTATSSIAIRYELFSQSFFSFHLSS